ncbi:MAG TPA: branched-chain amino acid aminotransferase, partial [Candidatus Nanopelagicales bacterium]|nr:branched-chain amino acid aminotransferase [Candidatus Nanopelagicales bacterium]
MSTTIPRTLSSTPRTPEQIAEIQANPGFGRFFTDHMVTIRWTEDAGWHDAALVPYGSIPFDPATNVLHYGQAVFEGLKAYRQADGSIATFRPDANARRFQRSAARLAMPELPEELFLASIEALVDQDQAYVPSDPEESLYLRPFMFSTEVGLGVRPANAYLYVLIASPVGAYFPSGVKPVSVWLSTEYVRAAPGGTGEAKFAGNYAASLVAQAQAAEKGCD